MAGSMKVIEQSQGKLMGAKENLPIRDEGNRPITGQVKEGLIELTNQRAFWEPFVWVDEGTYYVACAYFL